MMPKMNFLVPEGRLHNVLKDLLRLYAGSDLRGLQYWSDLKVFPGLHCSANWILPYLGERGYCCFADGAFKLLCRSPCSLLETVFVISCKGLAISEGRRKEKL